jgi:glycosyltransferase involved in cell wall biosynthesis
VLEAMSCGVIPVLTDIPAFKQITNNGRCGILFPVGNSDAMAAAVLRTTSPEATVLAQNVLHFFSSSLSYDAIAAIYETIMCRRAT